MSSIDFAHLFKPVLLVLLLPPVPWLLLVIIGAGLLRRHRHAGRALLRRPREQHQAPSDVRRAARLGFALEHDDVRSGRDRVSRRR